MGFDWENQRSAHIPNMQVNGGLFEFSSGSNTIDVPTTLSRVMGGFAVADLTATGDAQKTLIAYKVGDASNGAITFIRGGGLVDEDARMSYWLLGY